MERLVVAVFAFCVAYGVIYLLDYLDYRAKMKDKANDER